MFDEDLNISCSRVAREPGERPRYLEVSRALVASPGSTVKARWSSVTPSW